MHFVVKLFPEITIKSSRVRARWTRALASNLRQLIKPLCQEAGVKDLQVQDSWDRIDITLPGDEPLLGRQIAEVLQCTPGIGVIERVEAYPLTTLEEAGEQAARIFAERVRGKTFRMSVKRSGKHAFNSMEAERVIGGVIKARTDNAGVNLSQPEEHLMASIVDDRLLLATERWQGLGGFPISTQEAVLSLISGGFDSTVASFQMIRRGMTTHFCFFNLGGSEHELGVKEIAYYLWNKYGSTQKVKFVTVPFEEVVSEILTKVDNSQMGVILKRMMLRAATRVAERLQINALVTGEALAQVSSQTLTNLKVIDAVTDALVLRPLIASNKDDIIKVTRQIGAEEFAAAMPEYCAVISQKPTTKASFERIEKEEGQFDFATLERAVANCRISNIQHVLKTDQQKVALLVTDQPQAEHCVIDVRHPDEQELKPLKVEGALQIPFYNLDRAFAELDKDRVYLLYCDKGVMSQLHAAHLSDLGYRNVGVYRPAPADN